MKKNPNNDLLVAGARDFLKASAAIARFGDEVYDAGFKVLTRRAGALADALRIAVDPDKIDDSPKYGYVGSRFDGTTTLIGPYVPLTDYHFFNLYVWWRADDEHGGKEICSAVASVECRAIRVADSLHEALRNRFRAIKRDGSEVYVEKLLQPEDFVRLDSHFEALVTQWITHSKSIGGLKKYLL
ncbi:MAG: hypothetical protein ABSF98_08580 [Bryobacteraceae bacterium]|jgi:hypothetical protein